jgi:hypothetical protein
VMLHHLPWETFFRGKVNQIGSSRILVGKMAGGKPLCSSVVNMLLGFSGG